MTKGGEGEKQGIEKVEQDYQFDSDEESIYEQYDFDEREMAKEIRSRFNIFAESSVSSNAVSNMVRRFKEKSQSYEFIVRFGVTVEKTDESTISMAGNTPGEIVDVKERRRYIREEMKDFCRDDQQQLFNFSSTRVDKAMFDILLKMVTKSNMMLNAMG